MDPVTVSRLLFVDDDVEILALLKKFFVQHGYDVDVAPHGEAMWASIAEQRPDTIILDLMMPGEGGLSLCQKVRAQMAIPIIMLTAMAELSDRIVGLELGADDYLTKPFHPEELYLRIQSLLRRSKGQANQPTLKAAGLHLDEGRQCVVRDGADIQLTAAEFRLLRYFMLHPEQILSKSHLAEHLYDGETERDSNVLEVHVNHLRRKLGKSVIETRRGQGYLFGGQAS